jgi:hypothetical protein
MENFKHLISDCKAEGSCNACQEPVKQGPNGNWYITMGHAGFNSSANNRSGYKTREGAIKAHKKLLGQILKFYQNS